MARKTLVGKKVNQVEFGSPANKGEFNKIPATEFAFVLYLARNNNNTSSHNKANRDKNKIPMNKGFP